MKYIKQLNNFDVTFLINITNKESGFYNKIEPIFFNKKNITLKKIKPNSSQFTEEFITNHADVIDWLYINEHIQRCILFSHEFFIRFNRLIIWEKIYPSEKLTTEFVYKHQDKLGFIAWYNEKNELHRDNDLPAIIYPNGEKQWYQNGKKHRDNDQPAFISADGNRFWYQNGLLHRDNDKPAVIFENETKEWRVNGLRHRDNGFPAVIYADGTKYWYQHGKLHRDNDEPAIIWADGTKKWYQNGLLYRDNDQPAAIYVDGEKKWFKYGVFIKSERKNN